MFKFLTKNKFSINKTETGTFVGKPKGLENFKTPFFFSTESGPNDEEFFETYQKNGTGPFSKYTTIQLAS